MENKTSLALGLAAALLFPVAGEIRAEQSLGDIMTDREIEAMGLDQLSEQEQAMLLQWIMHYSGASPDAATAPAPTPAPAPVPTPEQPAVVGTTAQSVTPAEPAVTEQAAPIDNKVETTAMAAPAAEPESYDSFGKAPETPDTMKTRIVGEFHGWSGATRFELENGQVWQQRYKTTWRTSLDSPEVIITRHFLGLHRMEVVGTGQSVPVKRIK